MDTDFKACVRTAAHFGVTHAMGVCIALLLDI